MRLLDRWFQKVTHGIARRLGSNSRRWTWNKQFRNQPTFALSRSRKAIELVERLANNGLVIELACGDGILSRCINPVVYSQYRGVDISDVAIAHARQLALPKCEFSVCDMVNWLGDENASLIIIEEALYYLTRDQQRALLRKCAATLAPSGHALVAVHSKERHAKTLEVCRQEMNVVEEIEEGLRVFLVLGKK